MRRNLKRYYGAGDLHFITCSCYRRQPLLGTARRRDLLLTVLEQVRKRYQFVVAGYVVMPEHIHLLISEPQKKNPSTVMQALKLGFARRVLAQARRRRNPPQPVASQPLRPRGATRLAKAIPSLRLGFQRLDRTQTH
jgi:REP element-mobilizing transposase RayT